MDRFIVVTTVTCVCLFKWTPQGVIVIYSNSSTHPLIFMSVIIKILCCQIKPNITFYLMFFWILLQSPLASRLKVKGWTLDSGALGVMTIALQSQSTAGQTTYLAKTEITLSFWHLFYSIKKKHYYAIECYFWKQCRTRKKERQNRRANATVCQWKLSGEKSTG